MKKAISTLLVLLAMVLIFLFSAQPGDSSDETSLSVGGLIGKIFVSDFSVWTPEEQFEFAERINHPVRKLAHATEYAALGVLMTVMFGAYGIRGWRRFGISWACTVLYAGTDEFHQLFVPGRSGQLGDVVIDAVGALAGILLCLLAGAVWLRFKNRRAARPNHKKTAPGALPRVRFLIFGDQISFGVGSLFKMWRA